MGPEEDFLTDTEEAAFEAESSKVSTGDRKQDVKDIWFAARDYFTQDRAGVSPGYYPGYFDERRAQVRLQILNFTGADTEKAKEIEAWVLGEK